MQSRRRWAIVGGKAFFSPVKRESDSPDLRDALTAWTYSLYELSAMFILV